MKFIKILIFSYTGRFSNYYNDYIKNRFLRNYELMAETAGFVSLFFRLRTIYKKSIKIPDTVTGVLLVNF